MSRITFLYSCIFYSAGALCPGPLPFKAIVCAAVAAAQAAYYLSLAEYYITDAVEAVALKARSSAIADTYANQSARAGAILPFTSALAGLCAAASAAAVEGLPFLSTVEFQSLLAMAFPSGAALFAAAASVAKARCEVFIITINLSLNWFLHTHTCCNRTVVNHFIHFSTNARWTSQLHRKLYQGDWLW